MTIKLPTQEQVSDTAKKLGITITKEDVGSFQALMQGYVDSYCLG